MWREIIFNSPFPSFSVNLESGFTSLAWEGEAQDHEGHSRNVPVWAFLVSRKRVSWISLGRVLNLPQQKTRTLVWRVQSRNAARSQEKVCSLHVIFASFWVTICSIIVLWPTNPGAKSMWWQMSAFSSQVLTLEFYPHSLRLVLLLLPPFSK